MTGNGAAGKLLGKLLQCIPLKKYSFYDILSLRTIYFRYMQYAFKSSFFFIIMDLNNP